MTCKTKSITAKKKAFTLIELLIVIAIIGILFIVLISKVNFATDKAKASGVQTDFRSFQLAIETVARENAGFSSLVDEDYEQLEMAINKNLDNKLKIAIDDDGMITMANNATDPWNVEYHGQYVTGNDGKDRGALIMYSNGADLTFGSTAVVVNGVASINTTDEAGNDDYSLAIIYSLNGGAGRIDASTTGFSNNLTASEGTPGDQPGDDSESPVFNLLAGIYEAGAIKVCEESGLEAAQDMMITPWNELVSSGAIVVTNGIVSSGEVAPDNLPAVNEYGFYFDVVYYCSNQNAEFVFYADGAFDFYVGGELIASFPSGTAVYSSNLADLSSSGAPNAIFSDDMHMSFNGEEFFACQPAQFNGDLILPADGSVSIIDTEAFPGMNLTGVSIPSTIVSINDLAFCETSLETVRFAPNSQLEYIGYASFADCWYLEDMVIPDNVKYIGDYAFAACESLLHVTINDSLEEMGYASFYGCTSLESITLPFTGLNKDGFSEEESNNNLFGYIFGTEYYDGSVEVVQTWYQLGKNITVYLPASLKTVTITGNKVQSFAFTGCTLENVIIGDKVEVIETAAFFDSYLTNVTIGSSLKATGDGAFMCSTQNVYVTNFAGWCSVDFGGFDGHPATDLIYVNGELLSDMVNLVIPDGVTHIGNGALSRCNNLTSVTIPSSVTSIGSWPFDDSNIESIYISDLAAWCNIESGWSRSSSTKLYLNGSEITGNIVLPEGIERVGYYALYYCDKITSITIPSSVTIIDEAAFEYCTSLKSVTFANNSQLKIIGRDAFAHTGLTSFTIPDGVTTIGLFAFSHCNNLTSLVVPNSVSSVSQDPCIGCKNLNVYITDMKAWCNISSSWGSLCGDSGNLYLNNELVTDLVIPDGVTHISDCAFEGCASIVSVTIPNSVQVIGFHAFYNCINLESIIVGNGLQEIGSWVFTGCTSLKTIRIESPIVVAADMYFFLPSNVTAIYVNSNLVDQYKTAYRWKDVADKIQAIPTT